jgi:hypothetical protein
MSDTDIDTDIDNEFEKHNRYVQHFAREIYEMNQKELADSSSAFRDTVHDDVFNLREWNACETETLNHYFFLAESLIPWLCVNPPTVKEATVQATVSSLAPRIQNSFLKELDKAGDSKFLWKVMIDLTERRSWDDSCEETRNCFSKATESILWHIMAILAAGKSRSKENNKENKNGNN